MDRQKVAKEAIANFDKSHPHSSSEAKNFYIAGWLDGVQRFYSLVKRMREAQMDKAIVEARVRFKHEERLEITEEDNKLYASAIDKEVVLEDEVDEYLEKFE